MSKQEMIKNLKEQGYDAGFSSNGLPTVFVKDRTQIHSTAENLKMIFSQNGYDQSFAVCIGKIQEEIPA